MYVIKQVSFVAVTASALRADSITETGAVCKSAVPQFVCVEEKLQIWRTKLKIFGYTARCEEQKIDEQNIANKSIALQVITLPGALNHISKP